MRALIFIVAGKELFSRKLPKIVTMKLRFEKNSLRYRLRKSDVEQLTHTGLVKESVAFPSSTFTFELHVSDNVIDPTAEFINNSVIVNIPVGIATEWINTDEVGVFHLMHINESETLDILIEKDFPCKDHPEEDKSDTFTELAEKVGKNEVC